MSAATFYREKKSESCKIILDSFEEKKKKKEH